MANKRKDRKRYSKGSREDYTNGGRVKYVEGGRGRDEFDNVNGKFPIGDDGEPVSYTHLTLPTILLV